MSKRISNLVVGTELSIFHHPRWRFAPAYDAEDFEIEGMFLLIAVTPKGIHPKAAGAVLVAKELAGDRRYVAERVKDARRAYDEFRQTHNPPDWLTLPRKTEPKR